MHTTSFWDNHHQVRSKAKSWEVKYKYNILRKSKAKGIHRIAKIGHGHLCQKEENLSFNNNVLGTVNFNNKFIL